MTSGRRSLVFAGRRSHCGAVLLAALVLTALAPLWHRHGHAEALGEDDHGCAVCAAVQTSSTSPPAPDAVAAPTYLTQALAADLEQVATPAPCGLPLPRGPPRL